LVTVAGLNGLKIQFRAVIRIKPAMKPTTGDKNIHSSTFHKKDGQLIIVNEPLKTTAAPNNPPIRAWDELLGRPKYHVARFQIIAAINAAMITFCVTWSGLTIPEPMVIATLILIKAPMKLQAADMAIAARGDRTLVAIEVAMAFAVS